MSDLHARWRADSGRVRGGLRLRPFDDPRRASVKWLGVATEGPPVWVGLTVDDARRHLYLIGTTGAGKTVRLTGLALGEAEAGRGLAVVDLQGDLSMMLLDRMPADCAERLVIIDPTDRGAPPSFNPLAAYSGAATGGPGPCGEGAEWAADTLTSVFSQLYRQWWGPRMDELMRAACVSVAADPGATLPDVLRLLTGAGYRRRFLHRYPPRPVLANLWEEFEQLSPRQRAALCAPLASRLRAVLSRSFAEQLLGCPVSTFCLSEILDGAILIARLPKGELGADAARLIGSLLVSGLWAHTTRRARRAPDDRPDATIMIDEAHNLLHLPIGVDEALSESRAYRVSWIVAHQHLGQLPGPVREAIDTNARSKLLFTVSPEDAKRLVSHVRPYFSEHDLAHLPARRMIVRSVHHGSNQPPYTLDSPPLPDPIPGRAAYLRRHARARSGLSAAARRRYQRHRDTDQAAGSSRLHHTGQPGQPAPPA